MCTCFLPLFVRELELTVRAHWNVVLTFLVVVPCAVADNVYPDPDCNSVDGWLNEGGGDEQSVISPGQDGGGNCIQIRGDSYNNEFMTAITPPMPQGPYAFTVSLYGRNDGVDYCELYLEYYFHGLFRGRDSIVPWGRIDQNDDWELETSSFEMPADANQCRIVLYQVGGILRTVSVDDIVINDPHSLVADWEFY